MPEYLMWLDAEPKRTLAQKLALADLHYRRRCRAPLQECVVNQSQWPDAPEAIDGVRLVKASNVLRHHFLLLLPEDGLHVWQCKECQFQALQPEDICPSCGWDGKEN